MIQLLRDIGRSLREPEFWAYSSWLDIVTKYRRSRLGIIWLLLLGTGPGGNATVTVCHSRTRDLAAVTRTADIIVVAIGKPQFLTADMVREGVVVMDVGINRVPDESNARGYRLVGDVDFDAVAEKASAITPVPGGVGRMTIAMLMKNTVQACEQLASRGTSDERRALHP